MAAQPIKRHILAEVAKQGGWQRILERISSGETITHIATTINKPDGTPISRTFLTGLLHKAVAPELIAAAQKDSARAHAEKALEIADEVAPDRDAVAKARLQIDQRNFLARVNDRETFDVARPDAPQVNITIGSLHLDKLRQRNVPIPVTGELPALAAATEGDVA